MQEIVAAGQTGLHFAAKDSLDLSEKVSWAWEHRNRVRIMGHEGRLEYENKYTSARNHSLLMEIYERALNKPALFDYGSPREDFVRAFQSEG